MLRNRKITDKPDYMEALNLKSKDRDEFVMKFKTKALECNSLPIALREFLSQDRFDKHEEKSLLYFFLKGVEQHLNKGESFG